MLCTWAGESDSPKTRARVAAEEQEWHQAQAALLEKAVKSRLALATDHFNRSSSKGFDYLQARHLAAKSHDWHLRLLQGL